jgi:integrase
MCYSCICVSDMGTNMGKRTLHKLSAIEVRNQKRPGLYGDGGGLYLRVTKSGAKGWIFRFNRRDMGLGGFPDVSLEAARERASAARKQLREKADPIEARRADPERKARGITFAQAAADYMEAHKDGWRNAQHRQQWQNTLATYAAPAIGNKDVREITADDCRDLLAKIWTDKRETASRLRGRIELVLDWCAAKGFRDRDRVNPAAWKGNLKHLLPKHNRRANVVHHPALPWQEVPAFVAELRGCDALAASALELLILTCARTGEILLAERAEIMADVWTIPATRMKSGRQHCIPLVPRAVEIVEGLPIIEGNLHLFPGIRAGRPLSKMVLEMLLRRMNRNDITVHGFRSSFRDFAAEATDFPREIAEMCLAHQVGNEVERAYRRSELLAKRRALLEAWADFCASASPAAAAPVELVMPLAVSPAAKREAGRNFMRELLNRGRRGARR